MSLVSPFPSRQLEHSVADDTMVRRPRSLWTQFFAAFRDALLQTGRQRAADEVARHRFLFDGPGLAGHTADAERELMRIRYLINGH